MPLGFAGRKDLKVVIHMDSAGYHISEATY